jgi:hypothetical protein
MFYKDHHIPDHELILAADGEVSRWKRSAIQKHLVRCWTCRARVTEMERTIAEFVHVYKKHLDKAAAASRGSRAVFKARLSQLAAEDPKPAVWPRFAQLLFGWRRLAYVSCTFLLAFGALMFWQSLHPSLASSPDPKLTPGSALPATQADICVGGAVQRTRDAAASLGKRVFEEYGIRNPQPRRYELDYLIDPDLGGSDDAANLWPQPYSTLWNAHVKDALEDHLRELVCTGRITLADAQHDISVDWISAYKKYFHTSRPLPEHLTFKKDQPWE